MTHPVENGYFNCRQPEVRHVRTADGDYFYLCLNGVPYTNEDGIELIEYDYKEIQVPVGTIDIDDIFNNPENYMDWKDDTTPTIEDLVEAVNILTDLVLGGI